MKRAFDIIVSALGIILMCPLLLLIFFLQKMTTRGPAIYQQERIGKGGKPFHIYKFRTMDINTEEDGVPQLAEINDDRLTSFGKFLRKHHLDEMPQLWNVLKGDMSFVGYRPERQFFIEQIMAVRPDYERLYAIRPGITSLATIYNGYTYTLEKMIRRLDMDLDYLEHHSFHGDLRIILQTFTYVFFGKKF